MEFYFQQGLAPSTRAAYSSAQKRYAAFSTLYGIAILPAKEPHLCKFVSYLARTDVKHSSIKAYLSAVRQLHIEEGYPDPKLADMSKLQQVLRGIKRGQAILNPQSRNRLPITPLILRKLKAVWAEDDTNPDNILLWAAACLCFFGFFRAGEITIPTQSSYDPGAHLNFGDIALDDPAKPRVLRIRLKASKTDPFRKGVDIFVGSTDSDLCPVAATLSFLASRGSQPGFLFKFRDGHLLTKAIFITQVRKALAAAGVDYAGYSGHSFRIGAATTAHSRGISDATIQMLGRWKSSAYRQYVQTPRNALAAFSAQLADSGMQ